MLIDDYSLCALNMNNFFQRWAFIKSQPVSNIYFQTILGKIEEMFVFMIMLSLFKTTFNRFSTDWWTIVDSWRVAF
jgi:hypothetical protein